VRHSHKTMPSDAALIEVIRIEKRYRKVRAVDGVSLAIGRGSCFGLLGPNGAGKTTLIEIIEDIIAPTAGTVLYKGRQRSSQFRQEVGIMFQQTALLSFLTVVETLETFARLYERTDDVNALIRTCHLEDVKDRANDKISGGQKQRLLMALALLNRPELIFLDEPSTGLDPQARHNLWNIIRNVKKQGKTIVLTTHYMEEAEKLCDDIAIMDRGRFIARGGPEELIQEHCRRATLAVPKDRIGGNRHKFPAFSRERGDKILFRTEDVNGLVQKLLAEGVDLSGVSVTTPNLEDVFLKLTGRSLRE